MKKSLFAGLVLHVLFSTALMAQETPDDDTLSKEKTMEEVILSVNKWELVQNEVPNKITKVSKAEIYRQNPQTAADLLSQSGTVFVQKSQLGGGSPMIRGFATNRVLLVIDGVRMNNAIYRSGNLQNVISIDPLSVETAEVIFGPGSIIYGSDAIGGVMDFHSLEARFSGTDTLLTRWSSMARYSSANQENTLHADLNLGWRKWSFLSSLTWSDYADLRMGRNGGQDSYLRPEYVETVDGEDRIIANPNPRVQKFSGYNQLNFLQKIRFRPNRNLDLQYSFIYAGTGDAPRYDRLIQYRNGNLRFAEWYYGPMLWRMHTVNALFRKNTALYDDMRITAAYQNYEESRIDRTRNSNLRNRQAESVEAISLNVDATRKLGGGELFYGLELVQNNVGSTGEQTDIGTGASSDAVSRYPDGSVTRMLGIYTSYKKNILSNLTVLGGLRYSYNSLDAEFDTSFVKFPYDAAEIRDGALTANAGIVYRANEYWQLNGNISSGYRMPNVDDIGKLFESAPGNITVPNPQLSPEYAWNFEAGIVRDESELLRLELTGFYTLLQNAIVRRPFTFNGEDSIMFDGVLSRVEALQNVAKARVWGIQAGLEYFIGRKFSLRTNANWVEGKETDEETNEQVPLRHAAPFYGSTSFRYNDKRLFAEFSAVYNGTISADELAPSERTKTDIYALDGNGRPYSPSWYTLNFRTSYKISSAFSLNVAWENITNQRYRPYSSGIVAPGSNFIISLRVQG